MIRQRLIAALVLLLSQQSFADVLNFDEEVKQLPCYPECSLEEELEYSEILSELQMTDLGLYQHEEEESPLVDAFYQGASDATSLYEKLSRSASRVSGFPLSALRDQVNFFFRNSRSIRNKKYLVLIDFRKASKYERMYIFDTATGAMTSHYTAHGVGSGGLYATRFSNVEGSKKSSLGYLVTGSTYYGGNGLSLNLHGLESRNSRAYERRIVIHKADYLSAEYIRRKGMAGNSWGCPAVRNSDHYLVNRLAKGVLVYKHY